MSKESKHFYEFGPFRIDPEERLLFRGEEPIPLPPKAFDTLLILVDRCERVVLKDDLMKSLWPDTFVEEANLSQNIFVLRKALGESAQDARYIATVPGRGYRFAQKVKQVAAGGDALGAESPTGSGASVERSSPNPVSARATGGRRLRAVGLVLGMSFFFVAGFFAWRAFRPPARTHSGRVMLAVLPFVNLTGDSSQEYVSDGLTEEMIAQLGELNHEGLGIIARTSAMEYKGTTKPVVQIGKELGVEYVLEGSVRRWGDRVRITAQLIQTRDQTHVWAQNYESDRQDILRLQSEVAQAIAEQINLALTPQQKARAQTARRVDPRLYELYLLGRYEWNRRTEAGLNQAIAYFQQAIETDPKYAPAYAGIAQAYVLLPYYSGTSADEAVSKAKSAAAKALQLDDNLAEAHATLGIVEVGEFNWSAAGREYQRALQLNPNYATARQWYSFLLWMTNKHDEALREMDHARQLDPLSLIIITDEARLLSVAHQTDQAIGLLQKAINLDPNFAEAHRVLAIAYVQKGQDFQGIAEARRGIDLDPNDTERASLGYVYAMAGKPELARKILTELGKTTDGRRVSPVYLSFIHVGLAEKNEAFSCLEEAYQDRSALLAQLQFEVIFDPLRSDPRFQDLWHRAETRFKAE
jgi:TolB-like protein/DNA-binding winged helix-turn-helix (wHTH) protein/Flp pilus assembly protein TadD